MTSCPPQTGEICQFFLPKIVSQGLLGRPGGVFISGGVCRETLPHSHTGCPPPRRGTGTTPARRRRTGRDAPRRCGLPPPPSCPAAEALRRGTGMGWGVGGGTSAGHTSAPAADDPQPKPTVLEHPSSRLENEWKCFGTPREAPIHFWDFWGPLPSSCYARTCNAPA